MHFTSDPNLPADAKFKRGQGPALLRNLAAFVTTVETMTVRICVRFLLLSMGTILDTACAVRLRHANLNESFVVYLAFTWFYHVTAVGVPCFTLKPLR